MAFKLSTIYICDRCGAEKNTSGSSALPLPWLRIETQPVHDNSICGDFCPGCLSDLAEWRLTKPHDPETAAKADAALAAAEFPIAPFPYSGDGH
jgi:hypothetical protein